jgi:hypothetical protein
LVCINLLEVRFLESCPYWKFPEETECCFGFFSDKEIDVDAMISLFNKKDRVFSLDCRRGEKGVWAKYVDGGIFFHQNVNWVHIYEPCTE